MRLSAVEMRDIYEEYVSTVSTPDMAISFELAKLLHETAAVFAERKILDLGSGFSSVMFRSVAPDNVWTVDDDPEWLEKTRRFLEAHELPSERMFVWPDVDLSEDWGLILHDLGRMPVRAETLPTVLDAADRALVVLDDLHKRPYRRLVKRTCRKTGFRLELLKKETRDEFGRYAGLASADSVEMCDGADSEVV